MGNVVPYKPLRQMEIERLLKQIEDSLNQEGTTVLVVVNHPEEGVQSFCNLPLPEAGPAILWMMEVSKAGLLREIGAL